MKVVLRCHIGTLPKELISWHSPAFPEGSLSLSLSLSLIACSDSATEPDDGGHEPSLATNSSEPLRDPEIDGRDTYLAFDLTIDGADTVELSEALFNTSTDRFETDYPIDRPAELWHVESGYDENGTVRTTLYNLDPVADGPSMVRLVGEDLRVYDSNGALLSDDVPGVPGQPLASVPIVLPSMVGAMASTIVVDSMPMDVRMASTSINGGARQGNPGRSAFRRRYNHRGGKWVLRELDLLDPASGRKRMGLGFSDVRWHRNDAKDRERRTRARSHRPVSPPGTAGSLRDQLAAWRADPPPTVLRAECLDCQDENPDPPPVYYYPRFALVHGFASNPGTWRRMNGWLHDDYSSSWRLMPDLPWSLWYTYQANRLIEDLEAVSPESWVLIAHSNGGIVSRQAGQLRPDLVRGVIAISSTHDGAIIMRNARDAVSNVIENLALNLVWGCATSVDDPACFIGTYMFQQLAPQITSWGIDQGVPVSGEMVPGNSYLDGLNSHYEAFTGVEISNHSDEDWVWLRLLGDSWAYPDAPAGGRRWARFGEYASSSFFACGILAWIFGYPDLSYWCFAKHDQLGSIDAAWDRLTSPNDQSDGIVQGESQTYPGAEWRYIIPNADSHLGETESPIVKDRLYTALQQAFRLDPGL